MMTPVRRDCRRKAISLIEILVVMGVALLLAALLAPAFSGIQRSHQLRKGGFILEDHLKLARQLAIGRNTPVTVSICKTDESPWFNMIMLTAIDGSGATNMLARPVRLPEGVGIADDTNWSSVMALPLTNVPYQGASISARQIEFRPSAGTALAPDKEWYLTVFHPRLSEEPGDHFVTISIDPVLGSIVAYEP